LAIVGSANRLAVLGFYRLDLANHFVILPFHDLDTTNPFCCTILITYPTIHLVVVDMKKPFGCYIIQWLRSYKPFSHCAGL
jgi:hypothetical protein